VAPRPAEAETLRLHYEGRQHYNAIAEHVG
jgi:hypothetical protein